MDSTFSKTAAKELIDELDKSILWKDEICVGQTYEDDYDLEVAVVGFGKGPHYEESIAEFTSMNDADAPLLAKAFAWFINHRHQILDSIVVSEALDKKYKDQKEEIIKKMLDGHRDLLEKML